MATLQEAIASGRPFRHKSWTSWYLYNDIQDCLSVVDGDGYVSKIYINQALSNNWEIKPAEPLKCEFEATSDGRGIIEITDSGFPANRNFKVTIEEIIDEEK